MNTPAWVTDSIFYEIFPDRFAQSPRLAKSGLNLEAWDTPPTRYGFKGGDLLGVVEHLDYLDELGVNALYLTPIFTSAANHRYHTYDYFHVDPLLGGDQALRELLDAAHGRGMRVVLDGVFNHASRGFWQFHHVLENGAASPFTEWFHFDSERLAGRRHWAAYPNPEEMADIEREGSLHAIGYQGWWDLPALPKFNTDLPAVRQFLFGVAEHWIRFGIDGWRLDVPGEIDDDSFWQDLRGRVRAINPEAYLVGEIWHDARRWLQGDQFDASMNYPLTAACLGFFASEHLDLELGLRAGGFRGELRSLDAEAFADRIDQSLGLYDPEVSRVQLNPIDSHDTPRFLSCARGDLPSLLLALTFLLTFVGAPCLFYGDEVGVSGGHDPDCRRTFPWDTAAWNTELREYTRQLIDLRLSRRELRWGRYERLFSATDVFAFQRSLDGARSATALNVGTTERIIELPLALPPQVNPKLEAGRAEFIAGAVPRLRIPARSAVVISLDEPAS